MTVMSLNRRIPFRIAVTPKEQRVLVAPVGELDLASATPLDDVLTRLQGDGYEEVTLDLRGLTFMDSTGIRLLVKARGKALESGTTFSLIDGAPEVCRVLDITGLREHFVFADGPA